MTDAHFKLVHSPLVGPATWQGVARVVRAGGMTTATPDISVGKLPALDDASMAEAAVQASTPGGVLVAHSAAGLFSPALAHRLGATGVIFVDALLPAPGHSWFDTAPPPLAAHLRSLATDGRLPPWPTWFGASTMARLVPDEAVRADFEAECDPLPLALFETPTSPIALPPGRHAYLRLSEGYTEEEGRARDLGWRVRHEPLHHLAMLTHPDRIAGLILEMAQEL